MERVLETHFPTWPTRVKSTVNVATLTGTLCLLFRPISGVRGASLTLSNMIA